MYSLTSAMPADLLVTLAGSLVQEGQGLQGGQAAALVGRQGSDADLAAPGGVVLRQTPASELVAIQRAQPKALFKEFFDRITLRAHFFAQLFQAFDPGTGQQALIGRDEAKAVRQLERAG